MVARLRQRELPFHLNRRRQLFYAFSLLSALVWLYYAIPLWLRR